MGYYTRYNLEHDSANEQIGAAIELAKAELNGGYDPFEDGETKWYEHEDDMKAMSKQFPDVLFTLEGNGESNEDMWVKYFKGGKMQVVKAEITFAPYNAKKLK